MWFVIVSSDSFSDSESTIFFHEKEFVYLFFMYCKSKYQHFRCFRWENFVRKLVKPLFLPNSYNKSWTVSTLRTMPGMTTPKQFTWAHWAKRGCQKRSRHQCQPSVNCVTTQKLASGGGQKMEQIWCILASTLETRKWFFKDILDREL